MNASFVFSWLSRCLLIVLLAGGAMWIQGCAVSETSIDEVGTQFQEGLQGRGRIVPNNPTSDGFGQEYQ